MYFPSDLGNDSAVLQSTLKAVHSFKLTVLFSVPKDKMELYSALKVFPTNRFTQGATSTLAHTDI